MRSGRGCLKPAHVCIAFRQRLASPAEFSILGSNLASEGVIRTSRASDVHRVVVPGKRSVARVERLAIGRRGSKNANPSTLGLIGPFNYFFESALDLEPP